VAAVWLTRQAADTVAFLDAMDSMHQVTLAADSEAAVRDAAERLTAAGVAHKLWIEEPEHIVTCLATAPAPRSTLAPHFATFKLLR